MGSLALRGAPETKRPIFSEVIAKTRRGYAPALVPMLAYLRRYGRGLSRDLASMANLASAGRYYELYNRWSPQQIRAAISRAGYGEFFAPENINYWRYKAYKNPYYSPAIDIGSSIYMANLARNRAPLAMRGLGGLPAMEWQQYYQSVLRGALQQAGEYAKARQLSMLPQYRSPLQMLTAFLREGRLGDIDIESILKSILGNVSGAVQAFMNSPLYARQ